MEIFATPPPQKKRRRVTHLSFCISEFSFFYFSNEIYAYAILIFFLWMKIYTSLYPLLKRHCMCRYIIIYCSSLGISNLRHDTDRNKSFFLNNKLDLAEKTLGLMSWYTPGHNQSLCEVKLTMFLNKQNIDQT